MVMMTMMANVKSVWSKQITQTEKQVNGAPKTGKEREREREREKEVLTDCQVEEAGC
jgi:hypothetical protein